MIMSQSTFQVIRSQKIPGLLDLYCRAFAVVLPAQYEDREGTRTTGLSVLLL